MEIFDQITPFPKETAVALGYFDGVHAGHRAVIQAAAESGGNGTVPVVFTFQQRPATVIKQEQPQRLITFEDKIKVMEQLGIQAVYCIDFSQIKDLSEYEFIARVLHKNIKAKQVFCGFNYHFGKNGRGNSHSLQTLGAQLGMETQTLGPVVTKGEVVSSSRIRALLTAGDVQQANSMLSLPFGFSSEVIEGNHIGRKLETPTINQKMPDDFITIKFGVYASTVTIENKQYWAVTNFGIKPTVGSDYPLYETWIPEYKGAPLYHQKIDLRLRTFLREEKKFDSLQTLQTAIFNDAEQAKLYSKFF